MNYNNNKKKGANMEPWNTDLIFCIRSSLTWSGLEANMLVLQWYSISTVTWQRLCILHWLVLTMRKHIMFPLGAKKSILTNNTHVGTWKGSLQQHMKACNWNFLLRILGFVPWLICLTVKRIFIVQVFVLYSRYKTDYQVRLKNLFLII